MQRMSGFILPLRSDVHREFPGDTRAVAHCPRAFVLRAASEAALSGVGVRRQLLPQLKELRRLTDEQPIVD